MPVRVTNSSAEIVRIQVSFSSGWQNVLVIRRAAYQTCPRCDRTHALTSFGFTRHNRTTAPQKYAIITFSVWCKDLAGWNNGLMIKLA